MGRRNGAFNWLVTRGLDPGSLLPPTSPLFGPNIGSVGPAGYTQELLDHLDDLYLAGQLLPHVYQALRLQISTTALQGSGAWPVHHADLYRRYSPMRGQTPWPALAGSLWPSGGLGGMNPLSPLLGGRQPVVGYCPKCLTYAVGTCPVCN